MQIAVLRETYPGERRVAVVPAIVPLLVKKGMQVVVEAGAGEAAGHPDREYTEKGAQVVAGRDEALSRGDVVVMVRAPGANPVAGRGDLERLRNGQAVVGLCDPLGNPRGVAELAERGVTLFALELMPRITRAQSMDVLSSMATIAGYKSVLVAASHLPRMFPMLMTAAGTVTAAKVLVIGAGVAGLQAISTARRLGAIVQGYDVRPAAMEQIESLGAKALRLDLQTGQAEARGGYARELTEAEQERQRLLLSDAVAQQDVCITTAAIPGRPSPRLVTASAIGRMPLGAVIVDLAAERGGNCEGTQANQTIVVGGVTILGPTNLESEVPAHASQMFAKNVANFLLHLAQNGNLQIDVQDEITRDTLVASGGQVVNQPIRDMLGLGKVQSPSNSVDAAPSDATDDEYQLEDTHDMPK
jgi:NAD(P) transhydrogenase subunit alpha